MTTIRDIPLNCPEATYVQPAYKEAGMNNFTNLVRTMLNDYGVYHVQFNTISKETLLDAIVPGLLPLATVFGIYAYLKKGGNILKATLWILAIAIVLGGLGILV